jgi:hypothetical protein
MMSEKSEELEMRVELVGLGSDATDIVMSGLAELGIKGEENQTVYLSQNVPTWLKFVSDMATWQKVFGAGAGLYVGEWVKLYAKEHFAQRKQIFAKVRAAVEPSPNIAPIFLSGAIARRPCLL